MPLRTYELQKNPVPYDRGAKSDWKACRAAEQFHRVSAFCPSLTVTSGIQGTEGKVATRRKIVWRRLANSPMNGCFDSVAAKKVKRHFSPKHRETARFCGSRAFFRSAQVRQWLPVSQLNDLV